jgi:hypothetical protein
MANVVTEEIGVGTIGGSDDTSFDIGSYLLPVGNVVPQADDLSAVADVIVDQTPIQFNENVGSPEVIPSDTPYLPKKEVSKPMPETPSVAQSPSGAPSMNDLKTISDVLANGACADADEIAKTTGLAKDTVVYCIEWLVSQGLVAKDATRYCGLSNVKRMCAQLKGCMNCGSN